MSLKGPAGGSQLCFQFAYKSLEGYTNLLGRKVERLTAVHTAEYRLRGCIFNNATKRFIGRFRDSTPCGLVESLQAGAVICPIEQVSFFYCTQSDPTLILVTELTATFDSDSDRHQICLGWCMLPLFDRRGNITRGGKSSSLDTFRLALYEGSPRALFSLSHPTADTKDLVPIPGCILTCSLSPHPTLTKALHLIPSDTLISLEDIVPGLIATKAQEAFPKLLKTGSGSFEKVSLLLLPSVDDFEDNLLSTLSDDLTSGGSMTRTTSAITIEERRLKVMLYNGWCYTGSSVIGYLERGSPTAGKLSGSFRGSTFGLRGNLVLKGSLEISDLIFNPLLEVVLQLEYVVSWSRTAIFQTSARDKRASSKPDKPSSTHSTTLTLAWAVWQLFDPNRGMADDDHASSLVSLDLKRGLGYKSTIIPNSAHMACYQNDLSDAGKVTFKFSPSKPPSRVEGSQLFNSTSIVQFEDRKSLRSVMTGSGRDMPDSGRTTLSPPREVVTTRSPTPVASTPLRKVKGYPDVGGAKEEEDVVLSEPLHSVEVKGHVEPEIQHSTEHHRSSPISRSVLAYFHNAGLEEFKDMKGNSLPTIKARNLKPVVVESGEDLLITGPQQIAVQLLGCTLPQATDGQPSSQRSLSFTLHFSLFPLTTFNSLCTPPPSGGSTHLPHLLTPLADEGEKPNIGVKHCYDVNHFTLPSKADRSEFNSFLNNGFLVIDVYDRGSLFLLGMAHVPLVALQQPSQDNSSPSYCQSHLSLPLLLPTHTTDTAVTTLTPSHITTHTPSHGSQSGTIYVRIARLPADTTKLNKSKTIDKRLTRTSRIARRLYGSHTPLGAGQLRNNEDEQTRKRKLARMQKVREMKSRQKDNSHLFPNSAPFLPMDVEASIVDVQREELKREMISSVLEESVTTTYLLRPRLGRSVYFEHPFTNTHTHPLTVSVSWLDTELKLVVDRQETSYLRQHHSIHTAIDDNLITEGSDSGQYGFFIHPGETVRIPFKYQSFRPQTSSSDLGLVGGGTNGRENEIGGQKKTVKVYLQAAHKDILAILNIQLDPLPCRVDQVFHFYHPERTFFKKQFSLTPREEDDVFVCCSEPDAICEVKQISDHRRTVFVKAPVKAAPSVHSLYIMVYYDQKYLLSPSEVWEVSIHSVHRVDHSMQIGQSSSVKLTLRGVHTDRRVACYSFNTPIVKSITPIPFLLSAQSLTEFPLTLRTLSPGKSNLLVSAVDVDTKTVINNWMVCSESLPPSITRGFQISLPAGGGTLMKKTISFTNPYPKKRTFFLSTSRPDVVEFDNNSIRLQAQETTVLNLNFAPQQELLSIDVYVFINDDSDQTEECFLVKTVYS